MKKRIRRYVENGTVPVALVAGAALAVLALTGISIVAPGTTEMRLDPSLVIIRADETFTVSVVVRSSAPVNVFAGDVLFNKDVLVVESIDYNTSIANVWIEKPWYENGAGTLNFGGGTTQKGGFHGEGILMTITFKALREGQGNIALQDARILLHDGLGTDATLAPPIDTIVTVEAVDAPNLLSEARSLSTFKVVRTPPSTDLDGDGKQTFNDMRIFLVSMSQGEERLDFNLDGLVDIEDLSILFEAR